MTKVLLTTNLGNITLALNEEKAPLSVANFLNYVNSGHYDGTIFHRIIKGFMVQGGGMDKNMKEKGTKNAPIKNEANNGLKNNKYTVAMARTMQPHSATAQFFINVKDNEFLNFKSEDVYGWGYAVFAEVIDGTDIVDKMELAKTSNHGMHDDVPVETITIESAKVIN